MTSKAISIILNKAWENNSRALIFIQDRGKFEINSELWSWKVYEGINVLCIFNKGTKIENFIDINYISEISIR